MTESTRNAVENAIELSKSHSTRWDASAMTAPAHTPGHNGISGMTAEEEAALAISFARGCPSCISDENAGPAIIRAFKERAELIEMLAEVTEEFEYASQYKGEYLSEKHGDDDTSKQARELLAKVRQP